MAIYESHPSASDALQGRPVLCDGSWPGPLSATVHWRAWRALHIGQTDELSKRFVEIADRVLALRAHLPPELHIWGLDGVDRIPKHWRRDPEIEALVRALERLERHSSPGADA